MRRYQAGVVPSGATITVALLLLVSVVSVLSKPTIYKRNHNDKLEPAGGDSLVDYETSSESPPAEEGSLARKLPLSSGHRCRHGSSAILVPVSSTVIPLPVYKVAYSLGVGGGDKLSKPSGPTKLITANKKKVLIKPDWTEGSTDGRRGRSIVKKL